MNGASDARRIVLLSFALALLLFVAWELRWALLLVYVSVLVAVMFAPLADWLARAHIRGWHLSRSLAVLLIAFAVLGVIVAIVSWGVPVLLQDISDLRAAWPQREREIESSLHMVATGHALTLDTLLQAAAHFAGLKLNLADVSDYIVQGLTTLLLAAYFLLDGPRAFRWALGFLPPAAKPRVASTLVRAAGRMQRWVGGQAIMMLTHGGSATIVFGLLHVKYFVALGIFAGIINMIPVLGPVATVVVAGLTAAIDSTTKLFGVVVFYVIYHSVESSLLSPRIMEARVAIPAVAVLVALVIGEAVAGIVGLLVSVPTAVGIAVVLDEWLRPARDDGAQPGG